MKVVKLGLIIALVISLSLFGLATDSSLGEESVGINSQSEVGESKTTLETKESLEIETSSSTTDEVETDNEFVETNTNNAIEDGDPSDKNTLGEDEIVVSASEELSGDGKKITIKGDVEIKGSDFTAVGNVAEVDLENNIVYFSGGVTVTEGSKEFHGEELVYNYKTKSGTIKGVTGNIENEKFKDNIYLYGQSMSFREKYLILEGGKITTCNLDHPHYHIAAKVIEIHEDDKLILRSLYYKEGNLPLLYFPYWQISLKEKKNYWKFPQIGTSAKEGFFLKFTYVYTLNDFNKGEVNIDYLARLGIGQGIQHSFSKNKNSINARYYLIYSPYENSFKLVDTSGSFNIDSNNFKLSGTGAYKEDYTEFSPKHFKNSTLNYTFNGTKYSGNLKLSYTDEDSPSVDKEEFKLETNQTMRFNDTWRLNVNANISRYQKALNPWITVLSYDGTLNYTAKYLTGTLRWQQEDKSQEEQTTYSKLFRQPELVLRSRGLSAFTWPITLETTIGRYKEEPKKIESNKLSFRGIIGRKTYKITDGLDFNITGEGQGTVYNLTSFSPYVLSWRSALGLVYRPVKNWTFTLDYTKRDVFGNSPFNFDKLSNLHSFDFRINNTLGVVTTETKTGYDLIKSQFMSWDNTHRMSYGKITASFEHSYNLIPFEPIKFAGSLKVEPMENLNLEGRIHYAKEKDKWLIKALNGKGEYKFGFYNLKGEAAYNPQTNRFTTLKAVIGRELHCRRLDLTYDHVNKAVWLEFRINAIGDKPMSVKMSGSGVEFSSDMLSALSSGN